MTAVGPGTPGQEVQKPGRPANPGVDLKPTRPLCNNMHLCCVCTSPANRKCSGCESFYYCSKSCQKDDWHDHKKICATVTNNKSVKSLQKTNFKCFVCKEAGIFLPRNSCCGAHVHDRCSTGGFCPKCGDFCGFGDEPPQEVYPDEFVQAVIKKMKNFTAVLDHKRLTPEEKEVAEKILRCTGYVFQAHFNGSKSALDEDTFIMRVLDTPRAPERMIVLSRIFAQKLDSRDHFPQQFARGVADIMVQATESETEPRFFEGACRSETHSSFVVHTLKWFNTHILYGPSLKTVFETPELCTKLFLAVCIQDEVEEEKRDALLAMIEESREARAGIAGGVWDLHPKIQLTAMMMAKKHKMPNLLAQLAREFHARG